MRSLLTAIVLMFFGVACNNDKGDGNTGYDKTQFTPPVIVNDVDQIGRPDSLTAMELRDDSLFADGSIPTSWKNAGITDVKGLKLFLKELQQLVMLNEKEKLSGTVQYPLRDIQSASEMVNRYDEVFTKEVKLSFAAINFSQLFRNQNGVMTQGGKVWIRQLGEGFKIVAINY